MQCTRRTFPKTVSETCQLSNPNYSELVRDWGLEHFLVFITSFQLVLVNSARLSNILTPILATPPDLSVGSSKLASRKVKVAPLEGDDKL